MRAAARLAVRKSHSPRWGTLGARNLMPEHAAECMVTNRNERKRATALAGQLASAAAAVRCRSSDKGRIADVDRNQDIGLEIHIVPDPFEGDIADSYFPAKFTHADYPRLVTDGQDVGTIAVGSILAVFNWPERSDRYKRVKNFVKAFFSRFDEFLQPGRHPKWKEVSLTAEVPGWQRSKPAQDWINSGVASGTGIGVSAADFAAFLQSRDPSATDSARVRLFQEFLAWHRSRATAQTGATR